MPSPFFVTTSQGPTSGAKCYENPTYLLARIAAAYRMNLDRPLSLLERGNLWSMLTLVAGVHRAKAQEILSMARVLEAHRLRGVRDSITTTADTHLVITEQKPVIMLPDFSNAFLAFIGIIYVMNPMYPGKCTYEFIQHAQLNISVKKLCAKVLSVTKNLATASN